MSIWHRIRHAFRPKPHDCPYVKCRAPMVFVERTEDNGVWVDTYRCTGEAGHVWHELAVGEEPGAPG